MNATTEWSDIGMLNDFKEGAPVRADIGDHAIAVYRIGDEVYAIGDVCPHQKNVRLSEGFFDGSTIECPRHQSCFDVRTGKVISPPARQDVRRYPVMIQGGKVFIGV